MAQIITKTHFLCLTFPRGNSFRLPPTSGTSALPASGASGGRALRNAGHPNQGQSDRNLQPGSPNASDVLGYPMKHLLQVIQAGAIVNPLPIASRLQIALLEQSI